MANTSCDPTTGNEGSSSGSGEPMDILDEFDPYDLEMWDHESNTPTEYVVIYCLDIVTSIVY